MSNDNEQKLGLDASDYFDEVNRLINTNTRLEQSVLSLGKTLLSQNKSSENLLLTIENLTEAQRDYYASIISLGGGYDKTNDSINILTDSLKKEIEQKELNVKSDKISLELAKVRQQSLTDEAKKLESLVTFQQSLEASTRRLIEQKNQETLATQREFAAEQLRAQLIKQFVGPSPANSTEVARVTANVGNITRLINQGQVSLSRVLEIIKSVQSGEAVAFEGIENQVARSTRSMIQASGALGTQYTRDLNKVEAANKRMSESVKDVDDKTSKSSRSILLSWQSVVRIFAIQTIHTALGILLSDLRQSITEAEQFQIKISEIRTISQDNQLSFDRWSGSVRALSDEFGNPINEVAAGVYETISNQIAKGADSAIFMKSALELAQTTVSTTSEAVDTLSSVLNSYQLSADKATYVSGILFKLVDLGRVRLSELANSFGRTTALAAPLGITLEEVSAAIATLTIRGVKYNEAYTLINNVILKLLNPTKDMTKFLNSLGFASGEAAIQGLGFEGVLKKIEQATNGSVQEVADLFTQMRALRGAIQLTGSAFGTFQQNLNEIKNAGDQYDIAKKLIPESSGKQFQIELNKIKNLFINDFGTSILDFFVQLTTTYDENGKKIHGLSDSIKSLINVISASTTAFVAYRLTLVATALSTESLASAIGLVLTPAGLIATAVGGLTYLWLKHNETIQEVINSYNSLDTDVADATQEQSKKIQESLDKEEKDYQESLDRRFRGYQLFGADIIKVINNVTETQKQKQEQSLRDLKDVFDITRKEIEKTIRSTETQSNAAARNIEILQKRLEDLKEGSSALFERQIKGSSPSDQVTLILKRLEKLKSDRNSLLSSSTGNPLQDQQAIEQSLRISSEIERLTNDLYDRRNEAEKKRIENLSRIQELSTRQYNKDSIQEQEIQGKKTKDFAIRLQQFNEQDRRSGVELQKLKNQQETYDSILQAVGSRESFEKLISDETKKQQDLIEKQIQAQKTLKQIEDSRVIAQQKNLEAAKTIFQQLTSKIKLPDNFDLKTGKTDILKQFDSQVDRLGKLGITDPNVYFQIAQRRAEIEKQLILETEKFRVSQSEESLNRLKQQYQQTFNQNAEAIANAQKTKNDDLARLRLIISKELAPLSSDPRYVTDLLSQVDAIQSGTYKANAKNSRGLTAFDQIQSILGNITTYAGGPDKLLKSPTTPGTFLTERDVVGRGGYRVQDIINKFDSAFTKVIGDQGGIQVLQKSQSDLGVETQNLVKTMQDAQTRINGLFNNFSPNVSAGTSNGFIGHSSGDNYNFGDINIDVTSKGDKQADINSIVNGLNSAIRRGQVKLRS